MTEEAGPNHHHRNEMCSSQNHFIPNIIDIVTYLPTTSGFHQTDLINIANTAAGNSMPLSPFCDFDKGK